MRLLFSFSLLLSAFLLFLIQPMAAKALLPVYGGTPAVWTACMLFFQAILLASYGYAWFLSRWKGKLPWKFWHGILAVVSLVALPWVFQARPFLQIPEAGILYSLFIQLGLPLLVIGASAPLLQFAYSHTRGKGAADPYFLYVASNTGSLLALLSYPPIIERYIGLASQFQLWSLLYLLYLLFLAWILIAVRYRPLKEQVQEKESLRIRTLLLWIFLSFIPCSLMLGVTFYITTDIAPTPLFWILPLGLYLLSFIITFASKPLISHLWVQRYTVFILIFPVLGFIFGANRLLVWQMVIFNLAAFFIIALLCHGELVRRRPPAQFLTLFYFCLALGGVLAGVFNSLLAPRLFNQAYEYPLVMALSLLILPIKYNKKEWLIPLSVFSILLINAYIPNFLLFKYWHGAEILALLILCIWQYSARSLTVGFLVLFLFLFTPWFKDTDTLVQKRNFYGIKQVVNNQGMHVLMSQTTVHGFQMFSKAGKPEAGVAYYGAIEPLTNWYKQKQGRLQVSLMGLGAGIIVCQFRSEDALVLIEIDQQVIDIAKNPAYFTYLNACPSTKTIIANDGRLALEKIADGSQDLIIVDAFSSDAIPIHLLTSEAFALYQKKLNKEGTILVNISNRHLNLLPVITAAGRKHNSMVLNLLHRGSLRAGQFDSQWVALTRNEILAAALMKQNWHFVTSPESYLWTDDYSNVIPLLKW